MNVLITGINGFLGKSVYNSLLKEKFPDYHIYGFSRNCENWFNRYALDITDSTKVDAIIAKIKPDIIFHLSGIALTKTNEENPNEIIDINIGGTYNLLRAVQKVGNNPRFIFSSSVTVYGDFNEKVPKNSYDRENPLSVYSMTKLAGENLVKTFSAQGVVRGTSVRLPALVGVNSTHGFVHDLIRKVNAPSEAVELIGKAPGSRKPFCHVDEVSDVLVDLGLHNAGFKYENYCLSNEPLYVEEVANLVMERLNKRKRINWSGVSWPGDNLLINVSSNVVLDSNSWQSIEKVVDEWMASQKV